jgi:hypothetical protein
MNIPEDIHRRLLFVLHRGLVESRLLARAGKQQQVFDLADALEQIPGWMVTWDGNCLEDIRESIKTYEEKYPDAFRYSDYLDKYDPPRF